MHICNDCHWLGEAPGAFASPASRLEILERLAPGDQVPSGLCPHCGGLAVPADLAPVQIPEGADKDATRPFTGWRWSLSLTQTRHAVALYLSDRATGAMSEIAIDSSGGRIRLEIASFPRGFDPEEAGSQLLLSLGRGEIAAFPAAELVAQPLIYTDSRLQAAAAATREEFMASEADSFLEPAAVTE